jgi:hypothetical protein
MLLVSLLVAAGAALANPAAFDPWAGIWILFLAGILVGINYPINLLFFTLSLLVLSWRHGKGIGDLPRRFPRYISAILLILLFVTFVGAWVDIVFVVPQHEFHYGPLGAPVVRMTLATVMIFLSVLAPLYLVKLRPGVRVIISGVMALMNPLVWSIVRLTVGGDMNEFAVLNFWIEVAVTALVADFALLLLMRRWFKNVYLTPGTSVGV